MVKLVCYDFEFNGEKLSDYGFVIGGVDSNGRTWSGGDVTFNSVKPPNLDRFNYYSYSYETPLSCTFSVVNIDCSHQDVNDMLVTQAKQSALMRWLMREDGYHWFNFIKDGFNDIYYKVYFISEPMYNGDDVIGFNLTITTDSPYAYSDEKVVNATIDTDNDLVIYNDSDQIGYIMPYCEITPRGTGYLELNNGCSNVNFERVFDEVGNSVGTTIDGRFQHLYGIIGDYTDYTVKSVSKFNNVVNGLKITLDESNDFYSGIHGDNFNFVFPRMMTTYDERASIIGIGEDSAVSECDIYLKYRLVKRVVV